MTNHDLDVLKWIAGWYSEQCDGDWEEDRGITLETLDNPGWMLTVDLVDTSLDGRVLDHERSERGEGDWIWASADGKVYRGAGGPYNLTELLERFRSWAL